MEFICQNVLPRSQLDLPGEIFINLMNISQYALTIVWWLDVPAYRTCDQMGWDSQKMWKQLSNQVSPWWKHSENESYIYYNKGDGQVVMLSHISLSMLSQLCTFPIYLPIYWFQQWYWHLLAPTLLIFLSKFLISFLFLSSSLTVVDRWTKWSWCLCCSCALRYSNYDIRLHDSRFTLT